MHAKGAQTGPSLMTVYRSDHHPWYEPTFHIPSEVRAQLDHSMLRKHPKYD